jgi:hypothetical protein
MIQDPMVHFKEFLVFLNKIKSTREIFEQT